MKYRKWILSVLIVVLGVAAVILFRDRVSGPIDTKMDKARYEVEMLTDALNQYYEDHGRFPSTKEGLAQLVRFGIIRKVPMDPWQHPYEYRHPGLNDPTRFDLWSYGADGRPGGSGADADIGMNSEKVQ